MALGTTSLLRSREVAPPPPASVDAANRREEGREALTVEIGLMAEHQFYTGFTQNISAGGLFLTTRELRAIGDRFRLLFRLPGFDHDFQPLCEVRWLRTPSGRSEPGLYSGMGVRFLDLTPEEERMIDSFIAEQDTLFFDDEEECWL